MIEQAMAARMAKRGLALAPVVVAGLYLAGGLLWAVSGAIGMAMMLGNVWLAARIIGGVAERNPQLLMPVALATFVLGLLALTLVAFVLNVADLIYFPVTGFTLIGTHLVLVLWEAAGAYQNVGSVRS